MTAEEWMQAVEQASGMSRQQFAGLGLKVIQLTCRRLECRGWHFVRVDDPLWAAHAPPADLSDW